MALPPARHGPPGRRRLHSTGPGDSHRLPGWRDRRAGARSPVARCGGFRHCTGLSPSSSDVGFGCHSRHHAHHVLGPGELRNGRDSHGAVRRRRLPVRAARRPFPSGDQCDPPCRRGSAALVDGGSWPSRPGDCRPGDRDTERPERPHAPALRERPRGPCRTADA